MDETNQPQSASDNQNNNQSSEGNQGQTTQSDLSWPSVNTSQSVDAIRSDIRKSGNSEPITTKKS